MSGLLPLEFSIDELPDSNFCWLPGLIQKHMMRRSPRLGSQLLRILRSEQRRRLSGDEPTPPVINLWGWTNEEISDGIMAADAITQILTDEPRELLSQIRTVVIILAANRLRDMMVSM